MKKLGKVVPLASHVFSSEDVEAIITPHLNPKQVADLQALRDVDFSLALKSEGLRFRANVFRQMPGCRRCSASSRIAFRCWRNLVCRRW